MTLGERRHELTAQHGRRSPSVLSGREKLRALATGHDLAADELSGPMRRYLGRVADQIDAEGFACVVDESGGVAALPEREAPPSQRKDGMGGPRRLRNSLSESVADPKPPRRIVSGTAMPLDSAPTEAMTCPFCGKYTDALTRHHVVPRSLGGDDVSENLVWACGSGTTGCHGKLEAFDRKVGRKLVSYCRDLVPAYGDYADGKRYPGWLEFRYLGEAA